MTTNNMEQIIRAIKNYITQNFDVSEEILSNDREIDSFGLSSLDIISLILYLEELYDIQIPFDLSSPIKTINDIASIMINAIEEKQKRSDEIDRVERHIFGEEGNSDEAKMV